MGANFAALQHLMSTRGADVRFVSVSIDPTTDTPARLAEWAGRFGGTPAWTLLNGPSASVNAILDALGMRSAVREEHSPVLVMGDTRTGRWTRASALAPPEELADLLDELRGARR
jgi:protein SCO1/2